MLINAAITEVNKLTGQVFDTATLIRWLGELDATIAFEFYHADAWTAYDPEEDLDHELLIPFPWDRAYVHHLEAMVYYSNGEYDRVENAREMAEKAIDDFRKFVHRTHARVSQELLGDNSGGSRVTVIGSDPCHDGAWFYLSAYAEAVKHGFEGTPEEWLDSLVGPEGPAGPDGKGTVFIPSVSGDGVISWTNDGGLDNPEPVSVRGPEGSQGRDGTTFTPFVDASGNMSWSNDGGKENPESVDLAGAAAAKITKESIGLGNVDNTSDENKPVSKAQREALDNHYVTAGRDVETVLGMKATAEGIGNESSQFASHAEGNGNKASGFASHAEGNVNEASGFASHAEGNTNKASGYASHAEGSQSTASEHSAHAEGNNTKAIGVFSHAEGGSTEANNNFAHAEGFQTTASGLSSHAEGYGSEASGLSSHAEGYRTTAAKQSQHVFGAFNVPEDGDATEKGDYIEIVGNGDYNHTSNARTLDWSGNEHLAGKLSMDAPGTEENDAVTHGQMSSELSKTNPPKTASGSSVTFNSASAANPINPLIVNIEPVQDLHGYDKPWPGGGGKNLLEITATSETINGVTFTVDKMAGTVTVTANAPASAVTFFNMPLSITAGSYILNGCPAGGSISKYRVSINRTTAGSAMDGIIPDAGGGSAFTLAEAFSGYLAIRIASGYTPNNLVFRPMICLASETDPTFEPYANICPITGWDAASIRQDASGDPDYKTVPDYVAGNFSTESWRTVKMMVDDGKAKELLPIGKQLPSKWAHDDGTVYDAPWDVVHHASDGSMYLQWHYATPDVLAFDAPEAIYYAGANGLAAGTYHIDIGSDYGTGWKSGTSIQFTLSSALAAGDQIFIDCNANNANDPTSGRAVRVYAKGSTTVKQSATTSNGTGGTSLGTIGNVNTHKTNGQLNAISRVLYGSGRYSESAYRQWLNSDKAAGAWWEPQNAWDRPPAQHTAIRGFLAGCSKEFLDILEPVEVTVALNTVEGFAETTETVRDKIFLPSLQEWYINPQLAGVEGEDWDYYKALASEAGLSGKFAQNEEYEILKKYNISAKTSPIGVRLRSCSRASAASAWFDYSSGGVYFSDAFNVYRCCPACKIRKSDITKVDFPETVYGGTLDVTRGKLVSTMLINVFDGTELWERPTSNKYSFFRYVDSRGTSAGSLSLSEENIVNYPAICSHFERSSINSASTSTGFSVYTSSGRSDAFIQVRPNRSEISTVEEWKEYLAAQYKNGTPLTIAWTPNELITYDLTPQQMTTLLGVNTVYADCGPVEVTWREGESAPVVTGDDIDAAGGVVGYATYLKAITEMELAAREPWYEGVDLTERFSSEIASHGGDPWAWAKARIDAEYFLGMHRADFVPFVTSNNVSLNAQIAGINTYKGYGDTAVGNHIDFICKELWPTLVQMNKVNFNNGTAVQEFPWLASNGYHFMNSLAGTVPNAAVVGGGDGEAVDYTTGGIYYYLPQNLKNVIVEKRFRLANRYSGSGLLEDDIGWNWVNIGKLWVPDEVEVCGFPIWGGKSGYSTGGSAVQYPLFIGNVQNRCKLRIGSRTSWWFLSPNTGDSASWCQANSTGSASRSNASSAAIAVPVCFRAA